MCSRLSASATTWPTPRSAEPRSVQHRGGGRLRGRQIVISASRSSASSARSTTCTRKASTSPRSNGRRTDPRDSREPASQRRRKAPDHPPARPRQHSEGSKGARRSPWHTATKSSTTTRTPATSAAFGTQKEIKERTDVGVGLVGAPECGDVMQLQIKVDDGRQDRGRQVQVLRLRLGDRVQLPRDRVAQGQDRRRGR
jgi:hypothetical protein